MRVALWIAAAAILLWHFFDSFWSVSGDTSAHAFITATLMDRGHMLVGDEILLPTSTVYQHGAHALAALMGAPFGSAVIGMHLAALAALAAVWGAVAVLFAGMSRVAGVALIGFLAIAGLVGVDLIGGEIVVNDFLPQLVAQAIVLAAVAAAAQIERGGARRTAVYLVFAVAVPIAESTHLVPALQLLGAFAVVVALDAIADRRLTWAAGLLAVVILGFVLHQTFGFMLAVQGMNGNLPLTLAPDAISLAVLALIVALASTALSFAWLRRRDRVAAKYLGALGLGTAGLCLAQLALLAIGVSADYAARKYGFALGTLLALDIAALLGLAAVRDLPVAIGTALPAALLVAGFLAALPAHGVVSTTQYADLERFARGFARTAQNPAGTFDMAADVDPRPSVSQAMSWVISMAALRARWTQTMFEVGRDGTPVSPAQIGHVITAVGSRWDVSACREPLSGGKFVVVDGQCALSALAAK